MKFKLLLFIILFFPLRGFSLHIILNKIPANTPPNETLYLSGNFNNWNLTNNAFVKIDNKYIIDINISGSLECKIHRGTWAKVESNAQGNYISNRIFNNINNSDTLILEILGWEDLSSSNPGSSASKNVILVEDSFFIPQLNKYRSIRAYLPPNYFNDTTKKYPVFYFFDGQNLFDNATAPFGEWKIDETLDTYLSSSNLAAIIIGIDHGNADRIKEYTPFYNSNYPSAWGDSTSQFICNNLIPYINSNFRTLAGREYTFIGGSSLGGLMSYYTWLKYPEYFSGALIFSPAFWINPAIFSYAVPNTLHKNSKIYLYAGTAESSNLVNEVNLVEKRLLDSFLMDSDKIQKLIRIGGQHNEANWSTAFLAAYIFMLENSTLASEKLHPDYYKIFPNPSKNNWTLYWNHPNEILNQFQLFSSDGKLIVYKSEINIPQGEICILDTLSNNISSGNYYLIINNKYSLSLIKY